MIFPLLLIFIVAMGFPFLLVYLIIFTLKKKKELQKVSDQLLNDIHTIAKNSEKH